MGYKIKWRFLLKLAVVLIVAGVAIHFVHRWQVRSQVGAFLHQADLAHDAAEQAEKNKKPKEASAEREREQTFLQRYVLARPDDIDVRERLARLMCQNAKTGRQAVNAYFVLEDVLRRDEGRHELRRFAIDFALTRLGFIKEAKENLDVLLKKDPKDGGLCESYARCIALERNFAEAEARYRWATNDFDLEEWKKLGHKQEEFPPVRPESIRVDSYAGLAFVQRQLGKSEDADKAIHSMLDANREDYRAYLFAVSYLRDHGLPALPVAGKEKPPITLESLVSNAYKLNPDDLNVLIVAGDLARLQARIVGRRSHFLMRLTEKAKTQEAREHLTRAIEKHPFDANSYLALASLEAETRSVNNALDVVQRGLAKEELQNSPELLSGLLEFQFRTDNVAGAAETLKKLQALDLRPGTEAFESARVMILEERWKEAAATLERAIPQLQDKSTTVRQAYLLLGRCYEQLGDPDRRLRAYQLALTDDLGSPLWGSAMIGVAESETALGRVDDALKTYGKMADLFPAMWVRVARLELLKVLRDPADKRNWTEVDTALGKAEKLVGTEFLPDPTDLRILQATVSHHKGKPDEARKLLAKLSAEQPKNATVRVELAMQSLREATGGLILRAAKLSQALTVLEQAVKDIGDSTELRLARGRALAAMKPAGLSEKLRELGEWSDSLVPPSLTAAEKLSRKRGFFRGLAEIATISGENRAADHLWAELVAAKPFDVSVQLFRFDRALRADDRDAMKAIQLRINELEGENGRTSRYMRAVILVKESEGSNNRELRNQALRILEDLDREPLGSLGSRVSVALAIIHELNGSTDLAEAKYQQAIERGETSPQVLLRFFSLLSSSKDDKKIKEALALLKKLENAPNLGQDFLWRAATVSLQADDPVRALKFAEDAQLEKSTRYRDQIALGHLFWQTKQKDPAKCFEKATSLAPEVMETWLTRMQYLLATGNREEAEKVFEQARRSVKQADLDFFLALSHAQKGEKDKAIEAFKRARSGQPSDVRILSAEANYHLQTGNLPEARAGFERVVASPSATEAEKTVAQQRLALATAADPDFKTSSSALNLVPLTGKETPDQIRAHAVILGLQKSRASKLAAIRLLEEHEKGSSVGERFLVAQLYEAVGNQTGVPLVMDKLLDSSANRIPLYLRFYARWLIRDGQLSKAALRIDQLVKVDPDSLQTAELKARLAAARKDHRAAWDALRPKAEAKGAPLALIAGICEDIGLYDDAERLLRSFVEKNKPTQPKVELALAAFHGRRGRTEEGIRICEETSGRIPLAIVADVAINVLYNSPSPSAALLEKVAGWLNAAPNRIELLQQLAAINNLQGRYEESKAIYREILARNEKDALALNNLAYLLSAIDRKVADERKKPDENEGRPNAQVQTEALAMVRQAKAIMGENPVLLDTEALILLNFDKPLEALPLMETVVAEAPSASAYFHLAQVEDRLKHEIERQTAWRRAKELGLKPGDLHPLERSAYEKAKLQWN